MEGKETEAEEGQKAVRDSDKESDSVQFRFGMKRTVLAIRE